MPEAEKLSLLSSLTQPAGFVYLSDQDIFTSALDAWQRDFDYSAFYDYTALLGQMVFECLPVYFDYGGVTWLIEVWKGQYGINTGAEIGIYHADSLLAPDEYARTRFHAASDEDLPLFGLELRKQSDGADSCNKACCSCHTPPLLQLSCHHWWLTGFCMGLFSSPEELTVHASISFPDREMAQAFAQALEKLGYSCCELACSGRTVAFLFDRPKTPQPCSGRPLLCRYVQWKNQLFCRIYCRITRCFHRTSDKLIYLYFYLPHILRRMIRHQERRCCRGLPPHHRRKRKERCR